jgi:hypothetical protein
MLKILVLKLLEVQNFSHEKKQSYTNFISHYAANILSMSITLTLAAI